MCAKEASHERLGMEKANRFKLELDLSSLAMFHANNGYNVYSVSPEAALNFLIAKDFLISISQPFTVRINDIDDRYKDSKHNGIQIAPDDTNMSFVWKAPYESWRFHLGTQMSFPTAPYNKESEGQFVNGSGRFSEAISFSASYISDPVVIGGNFSYAFATPQIQNPATAWVPCIFTVGLSFTTVLNNRFSVSCSGDVSWNSNEFIHGRYKAGQSSVAESLELKIAWHESEWALSSFTSVSYSEGQLKAKLGLGYTKTLLKK